ncbi:hypothetical protein GCM10011490_05080 [Pseudoclavibacter endophyticus]|nr:hypothetical protein GCM10011490_05080 [Pseudoclavibacter endophyticus]
MWPAAFLALSVLVFAVLSWEAGPAVIWVTFVDLSLMVAIIIWTIRYTRRQRRRYERRLEEWARTDAVLHERLRIARDLHDLASHGLGLMTVRAATAKLSDTGEQQQALDDIESVGRRAIAQLRQLLTLLRDPQGSTTEVSAPLRPLGTLAQLPEIVAQAQQAGIRIGAASLDISDETRAQLPAELQVTICAIVREALANIARHAGPTSAAIDVSATASRLRIDILDAGPAPGWNAVPGTGHGIIGLRERVALHDGTLVTGPFESGFRVLASLPTDGGSTP